jgi:hypothetical protein
MRRKGRRLSWSDIENGPSYTGDFRSHTIQVQGFLYTVLTLFNTGRTCDPHLLPDLYEPVLAGFAINAFEIRGYERIEGPDGNYSVVQEWRCVPPKKPYVIGGPPPPYSLEPEKK